MNGQRDKRAMPEGVGPDLAPTPRDTDIVCNWRPWPGTLAFFARGLISLGRN